MTTFSEYEKTLARRVECEQDGLYFTRYFMKWRMGSKMNVGPHHKVIQSALDRTLLPPSHPDFISRLIVNVPPGYTKTELCVIHYMARGLALNPSSRFLHLSYSNDLALLNSNAARQIVRSEEYQAMWPLQIKDDTDAKNLWHTEQSGGVKAGSSLGQVTGFRAGHMDYLRFTGSLIIDDPIKPSEANADSGKIRELVNDNYNQTIASRVAVETNPIIVVMQRVHFNDLSGYLLRGGSGEKWHHLNLPIVIDNSEPYPSEYTHGIPIEHNLDNGWLWPYKHNQEHELSLRSHRRKFAAQYMQSPLKRDEETALWDEKLISKAKETEPKGKPQRTVVAVDPATTDTEKSDEHGIVAATKYGPKSFSVDADYSRKGSPSTWAKAAIHAYQIHEADAIVIETNQGGDMCEDTLRNAGFKGRVIKVTAKKNKTLRAEPVVALYELGQVHHKAGLSKLEDEQCDFDPVTQKANGKSPNRLDAAVYALTELAGIGDNAARVRTL